MPTPFTKEELEKQSRARETADNISTYLNQMEEICSHPMSEQEKAESFNQMALYLGKAMVAFTQLCQDMNIYAKRGARGAIIKETKNYNSEDNFEYVEG